MMARPSFNTAKAPQPGAANTQIEFRKWHGREPEPASFNAAKIRGLEAEAAASRAANNEAPACLMGDGGEPAAGKSKLVGYRVWMKFSKYNRWYKMRRKRLYFDIEANIRSGVQRIMSRSKEIIASGARKVEQWAKLFQSHFRLETQHENFKPHGRHHAPKAPEIQVRVPEPECT